MKEIVEIIKLTKRYREPAGERIIFENISLKVERGDFITITGPSGCGKTTLLNIISNLDTKYDGNVFFEGRDIRKISEKEKDTIRLKKIGYIFQFDSLINELTVIENITIPSLAAGKKSNISKAINMLEKFDMIHLAEKYPSELSGGEKQRIAIMRAIINSPVLLLADEPTGNLDNENTLKVMDDIKKLNEQDGLTVLLVSHNIELVKKYSKKIYKIENRNLYQL